MAKAVVLGATGHMGAHVVRALLREGHEVRAAYRSEKFLSVLEKLPVERIKVDLETEEGLAEAVQGCSWVFYAAGYYPSSKERNRAQVIEKATQSARSVLRAIQRAQPTRVVFTSSAATIRPVTDRPAAEEDAETWPISGWRSLYSTAKIAMEQEALHAAQEGMPIVIVNPSICVGEYDSRAFSGRILLVFAKNRVPWYVDTVVNVVYTGDVGVGHVRAAQRGQIGQRYLLTGRNLTLKEFGTLVAQEAGTVPPRWKVPHFAAYAIGSAAELWARGSRTDPLFTREEVRRAKGGYPLDGSKAFRELGMPQTSTVEAIRRALSWFKQRGYLS